MPGPKVVLPRAQKPEHMNRVSHVRHVVRGKGMAAWACERLSGVLEEAMRWSRVVVLLGLSLSQCRAAKALPVVSGCVVDTFVTGIAKPYRLTFDHKGTLFVGVNQNLAVERVKRVAQPGGVFTDYGVGSYDDPDAVLMDHAGAVAGTPGALLVARGDVTNGGTLMAVLPDQSVVTVLGASMLLKNPDDMVLDHQGRLLITDFAGDRVVARSGGGPLVTLFTFSGGHPESIVIDEAGRIITSASDGVVRIHSPTGQLVDDHFATGVPDAPLAIGPGGAFWGRELYLVDNSAGTLERISSSGVRTVLGTGFGLVTALEFSPDSVLYLSSYLDSAVLRVWDVARLDAPVSRVAPRMKVCAAPNPSRQRVQLSVDLERAQSGAQVEVFSVAGNRVRSLSAGPQANGSIGVVWDGLDDSGYRVGPGVYFARVTSGSSSAITRFAIIAP